MSKDSERLISKFHITAHTVEDLEKEEHSSIPRGLKAGTMFLEIILELL